MRNKVWSNPEVKLNCREYGKLGDDLPICTCFTALLLLLLYYSLYIELSVINCNVHLKTVLCKISTCCVPTSNSLICEFPCGSGVRMILSNI